jgi:periplasmic protein TonB
LLSSAETALTEARIDDAERLAVAAQALSQTELHGAENSRVRFLQTQIARERERVGDEEQRRSAIGARKERVATYVRLAGERMQKGTLIEPSRDSAVYYVETALDLSPGDGDAQQARAALIKALLAAADRSLGSDDIDGARRVVDAAAGLGAPKVELDRLRRRADELRSGAASASGANESAGAAPAATSSASPATAASAAAAPTATSATPAAAPAGSGSANIISANTLNRVRYVEVQYPDSARLRGVTGYVEMEFTVAADGSVKDLVVIEAEPRNTFERNTVAAVRKWRYAPVLRNGVAVEQRARLRVRFNSN